MEETNEERFTRYFCQYNDDLFLYLVRDLSVDKDTGIDLLSDVWVVFWEKFHTCRCSVPGWMEPRATRSSGSRSCPWQGVGTT